tara:strand:+ start:1119 stop:1409 length:291 start_codon:yes stop_codon:yes gene_type:complete
MSDNFVDSESVLDKVLEDTTCFREHKEAGTPCQKKSCKYWIECETNNNCTMIAAEKGPMTLQEIGDIFGVTRMRICQIEKTVLKKLCSRTASLSDL